MAAPDESRRRTWRFRLDDATTLGVSSPPRATEKQVRRRGRWSLIVGTVIAMLSLGAVMAYADAITDVSVTVKGSEATNTYTKSTAVKVAVSATHCPPGGDMDAIEVSFRNSASDAWTIVKADGVAWPSGDCVSGVPPATPAELDWTLATGADGARTVFARLKHGTNETFAQDSITLDATPPVITDHGPMPSSPDGANNWYIGAVSNLFAASDATSGLSSDCQSAFPLNSGTGRNERSVSTGTNEGSAVKVNSGPCSDVASNTNPGIDSTAFMIDLSDPSVAITSPADGSSTSDSSISASGTASDAISGVASVNLEVNGTALGTNASLNSGTWSQSGVALQCGANTIKAIATDSAGRTAQSAQITVTRNCVTYTIDGFYQPVENHVVNGAKAGSTIPLKFNILLGGVIQTDTALVTSLIQKYTCTSGANVDNMLTTDELSSGNTSLRFDSVAQQMVFNWKTSKTAGCYRVTLNVQGGASLSIDFNLK